MQCLLSSFLLLLLLVSPSIVHFQSTTPFDLSNEGGPPIVDFFLSSRLKAKDGEKFEGVAIGFFPDMTYTTPFAIRNFVETLPFHWPIVVITKKDHSAKKERVIRGVLKDLPRLQSQSIDSFFHYIPSLPDDFNRNIYSCYLISHQFYSDIPAEYVLIFQGDSIVLRIDDGNRDVVPGRFKYLRDFFGYPYIGGPYGWRLNDCRDGSVCREGGNGGLSLRRVADMIKITGSEEFGKDQKKNKMDKGGCPIEDMAFHKFFFDHPHWVPLLPTRDIGMKFSMDSLQPPNTWGCHQAYRFLLKKDMYYCGAGFGEEACWHMRNLTVNPNCCGTVESVVKHEKEWMDSIHVGHLWGVVMELMMT